MLDWLSAAGDSTTLAVYAQPGASKSEVVGVHDGALKIRLAAPAVDGRANKELIAFLSRRLDVNPSAIELRSGQSARRKRVAVRGVRPDAVADALLGC